jgi:hypothetical protein
MSKWDVKNNPEIDIYGNKRWYNENGEYHRLEGPAVIIRNYFEEWWIEGKEIDCNSQRQFEEYLAQNEFINQKDNQQEAIKNNTKCSECGGTGILDFGFYTRKCMRCYHE